MTLVPFVRRSRAAVTAVVVVAKRLLYWFHPTTPPTLATVTPIAPEVIAAEIVAEAIEEAVAQADAAEADALATAPPLTVAVTVAPECVPEPTIRKRTRHRSVAERDDSEARSTRWHFRGHILNRLDEYFSSIRELRMHDPEAYGLFTKTGLTVPADRYINPGRWRECLPASGWPTSGFGGILCSQGGLSPEEYGTYGRAIMPSFVYYMKVANPIGVQRVTGDVYRLYMLMDKRARVEGRWRSDWSLLQRCHIGVRAPDDMQLLKELHSATERFSVRRKDGHGKHEIAYQRRTWAVPHWINVMAEDKALDPDEGESGAMDPVTWVIGLFRMALLTHASSIDKIVVRATRDGVTAAFGVDVARCKYFFADRSTDALAADGRRKRIFHSVVEHDRRLTPDRTTTVRTHYRGLRHFDWNGAAINIVEPENRVVLDFPEPVEDYDAHEETPTGMITLPEAGELFAEVLDR